MYSRQKQVNNETKADSANLKHEQKTVEASYSASVEGEAQSIIHLQNWNSEKTILG